MLFFRKQATIIIFLALALICCGIFMIDHNMKSMTLYSGNGPLDIQVKQETVMVKLLGLETEINYNEIKDYLNKLRK